MGKQIELLRETLRASQSDTDVARGHTMVIEEERKNYTDMAEAEIKRLKGVADGFADDLAKAKADFAAKLASAETALDSGAKGAFI